MSCYHPMILINTSEMMDPEQRKIVERLKFAHKHDRKVKSVSTVLIPRELAEREGIILRATNAVLVPCGRCIGCRLDYSRQWAERCIHEAEQFQDNYFLTLTYDDEHLPIGSKGFPTLVETELSDFMKRLRRRFEDKLDFQGIRFFGCAEYGERSLRPHLHILLFNCPIPDLQERHPIKVDGKLKWIKQYDSNNEPLLYSPLVDSCWKKGTAQIGHVTFESAAYVARYIVKKKYGQQADEYKVAGVIPPYIRMSRNPGIGSAWYKENLETIYIYDNISFKRGDVVVNQKPGKYCDRILKDLDEDLFYSIKKGRTLDFYDSVEKNFASGVDVTSNNHNAEALKIASAKVLKRTI